MARPKPNVRRGFTLIEMLVAIIIILMLATLAVAIVPNLGDKRAAARGGDQLQGWVVQARSRAARDQAARGLRLVYDSGTQSVSKLEWVEQPTNFLPRNSAGQIVPLTIKQGVTANVIIASIDPSFTEQGVIQYGNLIEVTDGLAKGFYVIVPPSPPPGPPIVIPSNMIVNGNPGGISNSPVTTTSYRIIRRWRPLPGEPLLEMPKGVRIEFNATPQPTGLGPALAQRLPFYRNVNGTYLDPSGQVGDLVILFGPTGQVLDAPTGRIILWVRQEDDKGAPTLITIYTRSGAVAAHPLADPPNPPLSFTEDGFGSGL